MLVVLACWPFSPMPRRVEAAERVFQPLAARVPFGFPPVREYVFYAVAPRPVSKITTHSFRRFPPAYPAESRARKEEGTVIFTALCDMKHRIFDAEIVHSSGHERLDASVVAAAQSLRWRCVRPPGSDPTLASFASGSYSFQLTQANPPAKSVTPVTPGKATARIETLSFRRHPPAYPTASLRLGEEGQVVFEALCDANGWVSDARIRTSSNHDRLDEAVVRAAQSHQWRCSPISQKDRYRQTWAKMVYRFQLPT
ncbi:energy transducer TonB [Nitrospirillum pindoramense]|uniref:energy transducer TonB n=1 Tax=Nitrospirillum amazonense TaxID=28077 RepID=UPI0016479EF2|nr:energy transducer TonB [Nitrospirillum amazonense]